MNLATTIRLYAADDEKVVGYQGFTPQQEAVIRRKMENIPEAMRKTFVGVRSAPELGAKHGQYLPETKVILLNPKMFESKRYFGTNDGIKIHELDYVIFHEIGHGVFETATKKIQNAWRALSGWKKGQGPGQAKPYVEKRPGWAEYKAKETPSKDAEFTRKYGMKNSNEDFSDHFSYVMNGRKDKVPDDKREFLEKYLKDRFGLTV